MTFTRSVKHNIKLPKSTGFQFYRSASFEQLIAKYLNMSVFDSDDITNLAEQVQRIEQNEQVRYPCRARDCSRTYVFSSGRVKLVLFQLALKGF